MYPFVARLVLILTGLLLPLQSYPEEPDDFITLGMAPYEAGDLINSAVDRRIQSVVDRINSNTKIADKCDREMLRKVFIYNLDQNFTSIGNELRYLSDKNDSALADYRPDVPDPDLTKVEFIGLSYQDGNKSIYTDKGTPCCVRSLKVNGTIVGLDKVDHFFGNGGILWKKLLELKQLQDMSEVDWKDSDIEKAILDFNSNQEDSSWGLEGGVKSYGDLAANWEGLKFWRNLFEGKNPYVKCKDGKLLVNRKFKIQDYFSDAMNEAINCSSFTDNTVTYVRKQIAKLKYKCPADPDKCGKIIEKYKNQTAVLKKIISPACAEKNVQFPIVETEKPTLLADVWEGQQGLGKKHIGKVLILRAKAWAAQKQESVEIEFNFWKEFLGEKFLNQDLQTKGNQ